MFRAVDEFLRSLLVTVMRWRCRDKAAHCTNRSADRPDGGTCSSVGVEHQTTRFNEGHHPSMGWLWLGLAPGAWPLAPVGRRMGSTHCAPNHYYGGWRLLWRMAALTADGVPTALGNAPTEVGVQTAIGEAPTEVGTAGSSARLMAPPRVSAAPTQLTLPRPRSSPTILEKTAGSP
jgi:hypothetical protein